MTGDELKIQAKDILMAIDAVAGETPLVDVLCALEIVIQMGRMMLSTEQKALHRAYRDWIENGPYIDRPGAKNPKYRN